ncbi:hypothetical protein K493DRAFT_341473 [Basidiobolus meristosporus CBS 931.73]|uniref:Calcium-channel protein CCH1 n=1 Tax=Basidiobolus meristosporus CBS 931.73 TaxID=1314790 RepID=A0A1Y1XP64_9FUNG|nr:hypothetical protein K493DRAFT_341473 [Basidiobolus meristosporus CBS 931.73]|eukprot:ORX87533.1 hypothetical protein K493DRAFT_341473 [Basidiobolus meristosporus CBS 931.73]
MPLEFSVANDEPSSKTSVSDKRENEPSTSSTGESSDSKTAVEHTRILVNSTSTTPIINLTSSEQPPPKFDPDNRPKVSFVNTSTLSPEYSPEAHNSRPRRVRVSREQSSSLSVSTTNLRPFTISEAEEEDPYFHGSSSEESPGHSPISCYYEDFTFERSDPMNSQEHRYFEGYPPHAWEQSLGEQATQPIVLGTGVGMMNSTLENRRQRNTRQSLADLVISASSRVVQSCENPDPQASDSSNPSSPIEPAQGESVVQQSSENLPGSNPLTERYIRLEGNSLYLFGPNSRLRQALAQVLMYRWTEPLVCFFILLNWVILAFSSRQESNKFIFGDTWEDYAQLFIYSFFTLECVVRIIVYGLLFDPKPSPKDYSSSSSYITILPEKPADGFREKKAESFGLKFVGKTAHSLAPIPRPFLRHSYNRLDLIVVVSYWIDLLLTLYSDGNFPLFKGLCALRPIRLLMLTSGLSVIQSSLKVSIPILVIVVMFISYFFVLFGLIGVHAFKGSLSRRCVFIDGYGQLGATALPERACGGWYNGTDPSAATGGIGGFSKGYICPHGQICTTMENPEHGLVSFDNIFYATLNVFVVIATEGWTDIMYYAMDAEYGMVTAVYFCGLIFIVTFFIIQLFIASIVDTFAKIRANSKCRSAFTSNRPTRILKDTADGWAFEEDRQLPANRKRFEMMMHGIVRHPIFPYCGALAVVVDLISMSLRNVDSSPSQEIALDHIEIIFTGLFALEIVLRIFGAVSFRQFWRQRSNRVDLFLAVATCVVIMPFIRSRPIYRYFTVFQVMRSYRVILCMPRVSQLVRKVFGSAVGIWNLLLYTTLFILFSTSVAEQLFSGSFDFPDQEDDPYLTFDTIGEGFVALFQILTGENWTTILWDTMRSQSGLMVFVGAIFCVVFYFYSHFIIVNLFVAVFLENFEMEEEEKRIQQVHNYVHKNQRKANFSRISPLLRRLNPYRYLKPSPELIKVQAIPSELVLRVNKSNFKRFLVDTRPDQGEKKDSTCSVNEQSRLARFLSWCRTRGSNTEESLFPSTTGGHDFRRKSTVENPYNYTRLIDHQHETLMKAPILTREKRKPTWQVFQAVTPPDCSLTLHGHYRGQSTIEYQELENESDEELTFQESHPTYNRALFLLSPRNRLRLFCQKILGTGKESTRSYFDWFILVCIFGSVVTAAIDNPIHRKYNHELPVEEQSQIFHHLDVFFVAISTLEFMLRVLADGFLFTPNAYLHNGWNWLDFVVLVLYYISMVGQATELSLLSRAIRASRALRPLRLIRQFKGMRDIMVSMIRGLPKIIDATVLSVLFIVPFAIYGDVSGSFDCSGEYWYHVDGDGNDGFLMPRVWQNPYTHNFDNFGSAMLTLFTMASGEGWVDVLFHGMSIPINMEIQPRYLPYDANWFNWIYFVVYMLFGSVFAIQLFIGIVVEIFKNRSGMSLLTVEQRQWIDLQLQLKMVKPSELPARPNTWFGGRCFDILHVKQYRFSEIITSSMMLNVLVMMTEAWGQPTWIDSIRNIVHGVFALLFVFEILVRLGGSGFHRWCKNRWNLYDALVTIGVLVTVVFRIAGFEANSLLQIQKLFLVGIAIRVLHKIESLNTLLQALVSSLPSILSITGLYALVLVIYSILFQEIFGLTRYGVDTTPNSNFRWFGNSLLMSIRMTTGENWHVVMFDMMVEPPFCVHGVENYLDTDCGSTLWSLLLFISFYIICTYIFLNMFIVVVVGSFTYIYESNSVLSLIPKEDLLHWKRAWAEFDPQATGYISPADLVPLFNKLTGKFRVRIFDPEHYIVQLTEALNEPDIHEKPYGVRPSRFPQYNLRSLNQQLSTLDSTKIRERRRQFNQLYQEAMMTRERRGISFATLLRIFSYRLIDVEQYLGVAELLERKEVDDAVLSMWAIEKRRKFIQKETNGLFDHSTPKIPRITINEGAALSEAQEHSPTSSGGSSPISPVSHFRSYLSLSRGHSFDSGQSLREPIHHFPGIDDLSELDSSNHLLLPTQAEAILMTMSANRWFGHTETCSEDELPDNAY